MYTFQLNVKKDFSTLMLFQNGTEVSRVEWPEGRDMGRRLFEAIDELLRKNNLEPQAVGQFVVESERPDHSTSRRIAETVRNVYMFAVKHTKK